MSLNTTYSEIEQEHDVVALGELGCPPNAAARLLAAYPRLTGIGSLTAEQIATAAGCKRTRAAELPVPAWARRVAAAFRLVRRTDAARDRYRQRTATPADAVAYLRSRMPHLLDEQREHFGVIFLDARQRIKDAAIVAIGSLSQVDVHPREVFAAAVTGRAHAVILFHNHPSGDPEPSEADIGITRRLADVGRLLGVPVVDHIILSGRDSISLASLGLVPS